MIGIGTNLQDNIDSFLAKNGVKLSTNEYALSKKEALNFIALVEKESVFILGGDVWGKDFEGFYSKGDSFYCQKNYSKEDSWKKAQEYITNYQDDDMYFAFVLDEKKGENIIYSPL